MNNPFEKMKAPHRSEQEIKGTYKTIEQRLQYKKKRTSIINSALIASIAAIILFLFSTYEQVNFQTAASDESIKKMYYVHYDSSLRSLEGVEKWYYLNKQVLSQEQIEKIMPLFERVEESEAMSSDIYRVQLNDSFIIVHSDESVSYYITELDDESNKYLRNEITNHQTKLTDEELFMTLWLDEITPLYLQIIFGVLLTLIYLFYLKIVSKISPSIRRDLFKKENLMELIKQYIIMKITTMGLLILILWIHPALNLFIMLGVVSFIFILRIGKEYYDGNFKRSVWELPISIVTYTLILYLLHF